MGIRARVRGLRERPAGPGRSLRPVRLGAIVAVAIVTVSAVAVPNAGAATAAPPTGVIRVDQVGYLTSEAKRAYLMAPASATGERFTVVDRRGREVLRGTIGASLGGWNAAYAAVHQLDFSRLRTDGTYRVKVSGKVQASSPTFRIDSGRSLFGPLAADTIEFFQVQRDGVDVIPGRLGRKPSHLTDRRAAWHAQPVFKGDGGDVPAEPLRSLGGTVDVEGGWFDAGDFVKFTHATAYSLAQMLYVQRLAGRHPNRELADETALGLRWLDKMWDSQRKVLYVQVGIGTGSEEFNFVGDHDVWRLPEADDALDAPPGDPSHFIKFRPVFANSDKAADPVSPNLAGRVSAAFALGAQLAAASGDRDKARHWLQQAASIYAMARTTDVGELVTAFPHAYYPEDSWEDDMQFGATELAIAARILGDRRSDGWLRDATGWAKKYQASEHTDALNLYDTSAVADTDLIGLLRARGAVPGLALGEAELVADLRRQIESGIEAAADNPLRHAVDVTNFDAATRSFGYAATVHLYRLVTGDHRYDAFGTQQRNFALGVNAWGTSLVIGAGTVFPHCPQHQVANLAGSLTGGRRVINGAVVNGPNGAGNFEFIGIPDGAKTCPVDGGNRFAAFDTPESRFLDDVQAWPSVEPAIDFTATGMLAFALTARTR